MRNSRALYLASRKLVRPQRPRSLRDRLVVVAVAIGLALLVYLLTGGRWGWILIGSATVTSLLALVPRLASLVKPVGVYIGVWLVFNLLRAWADDTAWADQVLDLVPRTERWLAGGQLPTAALQEWFHDQGVFHWYDYGLTMVYLSFFAAPHMIAIILLWRNRQLFWRYVLATIVLFAFGMAGFFLIPTSPPWMIADAVPEASFARIPRVTETLLASLDLPVELFSREGADDTYTSEVRIEPNPIAAMPSIHFAATMMIAFPARRAGALLFGAAVAYTLLMGVALVYLGEHYVLDLAAGGVLAGLGWVISGSNIRKEQQLRSVEP